ncbi:neutral zinc metallopeptidase [Nocardia paucivorans]|uniref:neutral zinc metallopeptidase n=1 Tax=Nocardia paucivorans TaxID=114259 RepID=UPI0002DDA786|nr:neutral zinc metallopeptidase [Nocardia paucivorans]
MPPPVAYRSPGRPPRRSGGGGLASTLFVVLVLVVAFGLARVALTSVVAEISAGPRPAHSYGNDDSGPAETAQNPLLTDPNATLLPAHCDYARWGTDEATARAFFESAEKCLEEAWRPVLEQAGLPFTPPTVKVSADTEGITTPCTGSTSNFAAFYCPANKSIYMPISQLQTDMYGDNWVVYLSVFAHEYGHHVQNMSGILRRVNSDRIDLGPRTPQGLELSRRVELQANCFDGMYLGSSTQGGALTTGQLDLARQDAGWRGDQSGDMRDHGSPENSGRWFGRGADDNRAMQCNTFTASADEVG